MEQKKILIVEDESHIALALCRALEFPASGTHRVEISPVAETALSKLESESFDLVVTDLRMPGMGGIDFLRLVRERYPRVRTMLITAFGSPEIEDLAQRLGAAYLPKPFSLQAFVAQVHKIMAQEG